MGQEHHYKVKTTWTGNPGHGTINAAQYERAHTVSIDGKVDLECSSDTPFRGDGSKHNPEDFLVASLSQCHMLWYLHLCADAGVVVMEYEDEAKGVLEMGPSGSAFTEVVLQLKVRVSDASMIQKAISLHDQAHQKCFIANSVNFPVIHQPKITS